MAILERIKLYPNERLELEDVNLLLANIRTDAEYWAKDVMAQNSVIVNGFQINSSVIGQSSVIVQMAGATLINSGNPGDFAWYSAPNSVSNITVPISTGNLINGRNYLEIVLSYVDGTPLNRIFWDPTANAGAGGEFTQNVNTVTNIVATIVVNQVGFADNNINVPLAIVDVASNLVKGVLDRRNLLFRLGTPSNQGANYNWISQVEPDTTLVFTSNSTNAFISGEIVTFTSGATATVTVGGINSIHVAFFSGLNFAVGDTVTGGTSSGSGVLANYYEAFTGGDKEIKTFHDSITALESEIKRIKGSTTWFGNGAVSSLTGLVNYVNARVVPITSGASFIWSGTTLSITNSSLTPSGSDSIAAIRIPGVSSGNLYLDRQDGQASTTLITIPDQSVLWVQLPLPLSNGAIYSGVGTGSGNYQVVTRTLFNPSDSDFWIAYREGHNLIVRDLGKLIPNENILISAHISKSTLAYIGAPNEATSSPAYGSLPNSYLSNTFTNADSLTQAISIDTANINDIATALMTPYEEALLVVSGTPANSNQVTGPLTSASTITLPLDHRNGNTQKQYLVGQGGLFVSLNGQNQVLGVDYSEIGTSGTPSSTIQILQNYVVGDQLDIRLFNPQAFGTGGISQPFFVNNVTGQNGLNIPVGALYNSGTGKLSVFRNGIAEVNSLSYAAPIDQYQEINNNTIALQTSANPGEVFTFVNYTAAPSIVYMTGQTSTVLTVPTYVIGNGTLQVYRNGVLLSVNASAPTDLKYVETSTTSITLSLAATSPDVFEIYIAGAVPTWRVSEYGNTGTTITIPGSNSYTLGSQHLLVYRNGVLMYNSLSLGSSVDQYQQASTTTITLESAAMSTELLEFLYI